MKKHLPIIISIMLGVGIWLGIGYISGIEEAWDSLLSWVLGLPLMVVAMFFMGGFWPENAWRLGVFTMLGQFTIGFIQTYPHLNLWPFTLMGFLCCLGLLS